MQVVLGLVPDRAERVLGSDASELPDWLEGLTLSGMRAFGRRWTARVEGGGVCVDPA
jgi:hypothetical protein